MKTSRQNTPAATRTRASSSAVAPLDTHATGRSRRAAAPRGRSSAQPPRSSSPRSLTRFREGDGEPLLLIHGLGLSWRSWKPVLPMLTRAHDVVALDVPGFGTASPLRHQTPTVAALADAVEAELDRSDLDRVHVAGNSLGGWIALELARRGHATTAVALSPSGLETPAERIAVISMNELMRARNIAAAPAAKLLAASPASRSLMLGGLHGRPWRVPASDAAAEIRDFATAPGFQPTLSSTTGSRLPTGLSDIRVPVRICFGTEDLMIGALTAPRFAAAIPGAQLVPLLGCGHVPMADYPSLVATAITDLTERHLLAELP